MNDFRLTEEEIIRLAIEESREFERVRLQMRRRIIEEQDEEYRKSLEKDMKKENENIPDEPKEGDIQALRKARLKFFKK
jgi:hypothetical protein